MFLSGSDCLPGVHNLVNNFSGAMDNYDPEILKGTLYIVLVVSHLRIILGIEFTLEDSSFNKALAKLDDSEKRYAKLIDVILSVLAGITILLSYFVNANYPVIPFLLFIESAIIILFDIRFYEILFVHDDEKRSNLFIFANDLVFLSIGCMLLISLTLPVLKIFIEPLALYTMCTIYIAIAIIEFCVNYFESIRISLNGFMVTMKESISIFLRKDN